MDKARPPRNQATKFDVNAIGSVLRYFFIWKLVLLVVACLSPGPGYDTSTQILFEQYEQPAASFFGRAIEHLVLRLTRWDGIYFASNAARGHVNEQNWAFSWVLARCTSIVSRVVLSPLSLSPIVKDAFTGILISNASHLLAVVALYQLTLKIVPPPDLTKRRIAFTAACLHIVSPAGLFLSAPFGESAFAMLNFVGTLCYALSIEAKFQTDLNPITTTVWMVLAGLCFGLSTTMRSNGILSGILFAWDTIETILRPRRLIRDSKALFLFMGTLYAGAIVGVGFAAPQVVAYLEYCTSGNSRPWCTRRIPSIYSWVQDYYWEVGFLRYWTMNNLPLFLLAGPMLGVMIYTGYIGLFASQAPLLPRGSKQGSRSLNLETKVYNHVMPRLALPQLILAVMAATSFHVQIINRISSGYPVWYILLARAICTSSTRRDTLKIQKQGQPGSALGFLSHQRHLQWIARAMVMYAIVQGGLYASFLPPA